MRKIGVGTWECSARERELVNQVLDSGRLSYGDVSREFEAQFSRLHGCTYGVLSNSGTSSLQVALQSMKELHGWQDGDEVLVPAVTFVATVNIVLHNRMKPVLVDVERDYYGISELAMMKAITDCTKAVIPVHLFGMPCAIANIDENLNRIRIIEDSCETMFASHCGFPVGSFGDVGCFSTYMAHLITSGVGGIATTNDPTVAAKMRSLVNHGRDTKSYFMIDDDDEYDKDIIANRFVFESIGHSFRVTELEAALALAQLESWEPHDSQAEGER